MNYFDSTGEHYARNVVLNYLHSSGAYFPPATAGFYPANPANMMLPMQYPYPPHALQQYIQLQQQLQQHQLLQSQKLHPQPSQSLVQQPSQQPHHQQQQAQQYKQQQQQQITTPQQQQQHQQKQQQQQQQQQVPQHQQQSHSQSPVQLVASPKAMKSAKKSKKSNWLFGRRNNAGRKKNIPTPVAMSPPPSADKLPPVELAPAMPEECVPSPEEMTRKTTQSPPLQQPLFVNSSNYSTFFANEMKKTEANPSKSKQGAGGGCAIM